MISIDLSALTQNKQPVMKNGFEKRIFDLGIKRESVRLALGEGPSLEEQLNTTRTIEACKICLDKAPKNKSLQIKAINKMISLIHRFTDFVVFYAMIREMSPTEDQKYKIRDLFYQYGPELIDYIDDIRRLDELFYFHEYYLNPYCMKRALSKHLRLWTAVIFRYETIGDCRKIYLGNANASVKDKAKVRAKSIISGILNSDTSTADERLALINCGFCDEDTRQIILETSHVLLLSELKSDKTSFDRYISIFYLSLRIKNIDPKSKKITYRSLIKAYRKSTLINHYRQILICIDKLHLRSSNRLCVRASSLQDTLTAKDLNDVCKISECLNIYSHSTKSIAVRDLILYKIFRLAKKTSHYLQIADFLLKTRDFEGVQVQEHIDTALDTALYLADSYEDWRQVWWYNKDEHSPFAYKCIRRLRYID